MFKSAEIRQPISIACEGLVDRAVLSRVLGDYNVSPGPVYELGGKARLDRRIPAYLNASRFAPWMVHRDLDQDAKCAPELLRELVQNPTCGLCMIVAVRQTQAWLIADQQGLADFMKVSPGRIPEDPEALSDAKATLVELARHSASRELRIGMVPRAGSGRKVGSAYTPLLQRYIATVWSPGGALAGGAASLTRLMARLRRFEASGSWGDLQRADGNRGSARGRLHTKPLRDEC